MVGLRVEAVCVLVAVLEDVTAGTGGGKAGGPTIPLVPLLTPTLVLPGLLVVLTVSVLVAVLRPPALVLSLLPSQPGSHCGAQEVIVGGVADIFPVIVPAAGPTIPVVPLSTDTEEQSLGWLVLALCLQVTPLPPAVPRLTAGHSVTLPARGTQTHRQVLCRSELQAAGGVLVALQVAAGYPLARGLSNPRL